MFVCRWCSRKMLDIPLDDGVICCICPNCDAPTGKVPSPMEARDRKNAG